jgi:hypothetical protein
MLAHFKWSILVAHCRDTQRVVSTVDPLQWSLVRRVALGGSEPKRRALDN